ncbi:DUF2510 domain-containing protein [Pseudactinotalea terrae]|uniref:DUF2510 domain-containing protein n=1 Tax=Pseudactinotalea terrae TaxID=1743262 RepID=UPI0019D5AC20|nr:DUF2510 domain-containing protein [Pseudactinotalea terrae]
MGSDAASTAKAARREAERLTATGDPSEARRVLANAIRDLRELKRQINERQREIRAEASAARQRNSGSGQVVGAFMGSKARGAMARSRAAAGRAIAEKQAKMMRPLDAQKAEIDGLVADLDRQRARIADGAARAKAKPAPAQVTTSPPRTPPPPQTPPQWSADPMGRHQHRYWDGSRWTEHVSDNGVTAIDPF